MALCRRGPLGPRGAQPDGAMALARGCDAQRSRFGPDEAHRRLADRAPLVPRPRALAAVGLATAAQRLSGRAAPPRMRHDPSRTESESCKLLSRPSHSACGCALLSLCARAAAAYRLSAHARDCQVHKLLESRGAMRQPGRVEAHPQKIALRGSRADGRLTDSLRPVLHVWAEAPTTGGTQLEEPIRLTRSTASMKM